MELIENGNDVIILYYTQLDDTYSNETDMILKHDDILSMAISNPNKLYIFAGEDTDINNEYVLDFLSNESEVNNVICASNLYDKLEMKNFKRIRKSIIAEEFANIVGNSTTALLREEELLKVLKHRGIENTSIKKINGENKIVADVDFQECVIEIKFGRVSESEDCIYSDNINTNLKIIITTNNDKKENENNDEEIIFYDDGKEKIIFKNLFNKNKTHKYYYNEIDILNKDIINSINTSILDINKHYDVKIPYNILIRDNVDIKKFYYFDHNTGYIEKYNELIDEPVYTPEYQVIKY